MHRPNCAAPRIAPPEHTSVDHAHTSRRIGGITRSIAESLARENTTGATELLWHRLRDGLGPFTFSRRRSIAGCPVDFVCEQIPLVIQVDGDSPAAYEARSTVILAECGYRVLRFWSDEISLRIEGVLAEILRQLQTPVRPLPDE